jgi:hypothetical protein
MFDDHHIDRADRLVDHARLHHAAGFCGYCGHQSMSASAGFLQRFRPVVRLVFFILLLSGAAFLVPGAHSSSEPVEPLPVALPVSHPPVAPTGGYVGAQTCAQCHQAEHQRWQGSQHAQAMQPATE